MEWWGDRVKATDSGDSVSVHLEESLKLAVPKMLPMSEVTAVSLEFGTISILSVFRALRAENWLYLHGNERHPNAEKIKMDLLHAFYPDSDEWKLKVWDQGKDVVTEVLTKIS